jgi:SNF2 family DNA or RNA helicase
MKTFLKKRLPPCYKIDIGNPQLKNRNRSRWEYAKDEGFDQKRLFENESFRISRVESITFLELGHNGESEENKKNNYVYDLTVKDNHNYFANGVLVHNCHRLANDETCAWTKCFIKLVSDLKPKILVPLSGTLTRKRTKNLFPILNLVAPKLFPSKYRFYWRYCDPTRGYAGWEYNGSSNEDELNKKLKKVMIRRLKSDVLKELPPRTFSVIPMELTKLEAKNYSSLDKEYRTLINKQSLQAKNTYSELKLLAYLAKRNSCFNWIDEYLEDHDKLILAAWHKKVITDLYDKYKHIGLKIDGSVPSKKRLEIEDKFQTDNKIKVIILQIDAGGEGLTLTASNAIAIIEMPDTPGQLIQVSDRGHRIGLKSDTFTIYFPFADGTIENKIADEIENSSKSLEAILDGKKGSGLFKYQFKNL